MAIEICGQVPLLEKTPPMEKYESDANQLYRPHRRILL